jgi:hypothetical protein
MSQTTTRWSRTSYCTIYCAHDVRMVLNIHVCCRGWVRQQQGDLGRPIAPFTVPTTFGCLSIVVPWMRVCVCVCVSVQQQGDLGMPSYPPYYSIHFAHDVWMILKISCLLPCNNKEVWECLAAPSVVLMPLTASRVTRCNITLHNVFMSVAVDEWDNNKVIWDALLHHLLCPRCSWQYTLHKCVT